MLGPIVRIGPNELHLEDADYVSAHLDPGPHGDGARRIDAVDDRRRQLGRAPLNELFSKERVARCESTIRQKVELMCDQLDEFRLSGKPLGLHLLFTCFATDVITACTFSQCSRLLSDPAFGPFWQEALATRLLSHRWLKHFPILRYLAHTITDWLMVAGSTKMAFSFEKGAKKRIREIVQEDGSTTEEKNIDWQETQSIITGGAETISSTLAVIFSNLMVAPAKLTEVKSELDTLPDPACSSYRQLESLHYLTAVIEEGLRIAGSVSRYIRVVRDHDLHHRGQ